MLETLRKLLEKGPIETTMGLHGVTVMVTKKVTIKSADETGIVVSVRGPLGGAGAPRAFPWPAVMFIELEGLVS